MKAILFAALTACLFPTFCAAKIEAAATKSETRTLKSEVDEYGTASYYGDQFHGRKTASGERYDKNAMTCAHKSLPFGTKIRVVRIDNEKSVVVRVNDRGPYTKGFVVDLSKKAAEKMGMIQEGVVKVRIEIMPQDEAISSDEPIAARPVEASLPSKKEEPTAVVFEKVEEKKAEKPAEKAKTVSKVEKLEPKKTAEKVEPKEKTKRELPTFSKVNGANFQETGLYKIEITKPKRAGFAVQVSTLSSMENVLEETAKLQGAFENVLLLIEPGKDKKMIYKMLVGPYTDKKSAEAAQKTLKKKGWKPFILNLEAD